MPDVIHLDMNLSRVFALDPNDKDHPRTLTFNARSANLLNHTNVTAVNTVLSHQLQVSLSQLSQRGVWNWGYGLSSESIGCKAGLNFHHGQKGNARNEEMANARILPIRPTAGFAAVFLIGGVLAGLTARDANLNLEYHFHYLRAPFAPSLLYGCVYWIWWVVVTLVLWRLADRWAAAFKPSRLTFMAHLGATCVLATAHLALLQYTLWFASWYWPAWSPNGKLYLKSLERFGVELVIYGFSSAYARSSIPHADPAGLGSKAGGRNGSLPRHNFRRSRRKWSLTFQHAECNHKPGRSEEKRRGDEDVGAPEHDSAHDSPAQGS